MAILTSAYYSANWIWNWIHVDRCSHCGFPHWFTCSFYIFALLTSPCKYLNMLLPQLKFVGTKYVGSASRASHIAFIFLLVITFYVRICHWCLYIFYRIKNLSFFWPAPYGTFFLGPIIGPKNGPSIEVQFTFWCGESPEPWILGCSIPPGSISVQWLTVRILSDRLARSNRIQVGIIVWLSGFWPIRAWLTHCHMASESTLSGKKYIYNFPL